MHGFFHVISLASQQPFAHSLMHLTTLILVLHLKNIPIGHLLPIVVSFETSAPARTGHYLVNIYLYMYMSHRLSQCYFQLAIPYSILMDTSITYHWNYHVCSSTINEDIPIFHDIPFYIQYIPLHTHRIPMNIPLYRLYKPINIPLYTHHIPNYPELCLNILMVSHNVHNNASSIPSISP